MGKTPVTEKLTLENFWNECYEKWPGEVDFFCKWMDEYKKRVDWNRLFRQATYWDKETETHAEAEFRVPKFHDLPIGMQIGIFIQFTFETTKYHDFFEGSGPTNMDEFIAGMKDWFFHEHDYAIDHQNQDDQFGPDDYELSN